MGQENSAVQELRQYAWNYFALHADQRIKAFHFFIILETAIVAGLVVAIKAPDGLIHPIPTIFAALPSMMAIIAFVFWKLDIRTRAMIRTAEGALRAVELDNKATLPEELRAASAILHNDDDYLAKAKPLRYSHCFSIIFGAFGVLGVGAALWIGLNCWW